jgi:hypothetical protein
MANYTKPGVYIEERSLDLGVEQWLRELPDIGPTPPPTGKRWEHDCDRCEYQGSLVIDDEHFDFYICKGGHQPLGPSYIARFGQEGRYTSFPEGLISDLRLGAMGPAEGVLQTLHLLSHAEFKNEEFGFCVRPMEGGSVHVVVNPLKDSRLIRYVYDAAAYAGLLFQYAIMDAQTMHEVVRKISELVYEQRKRDR